MRGIGYIRNSCITSVTDIISRGPAKSKVSVTRDGSMKRLSICMLLILPSAAFGQGPDAAVGRPAFEVASIKEASSPTENMPVGQFHIGLKIDGSRADYGFVTLADLIPYAYRVKRYQVSGPDWLNHTPWNILAKIPADQLPSLAPEMMQTLLAERFRLTLHRENREQPVYTLMLGKGSLRLREATANRESVSNAFTIKSDAKGMAISGGVAGEMRLTPGPDGGMQMQITKATMAVFADVLTQFLDRPVVNATELLGNYEITLDVPIEAMAGMSFTQKLTAFAGLSAFGAPGVVTDPNAVNGAMIQAVKGLGLE